MTSNHSLSSSRGRAVPLVLAALSSALGLLPALAPGTNPARSSLAASVVWVVPASAHAPGANGANWRTDLEVHNAGTTAATYTVELLVRDAENLVPQSRSFSLSPQRSVRYVDALMGIFSFSGAAALRITASSDLVMVTSRTYNQIGENPWSLPEGSSFGQFVPAMAETQAIAYGEEGRLIQLTQQPAETLAGFRTNVGLVNATGAALDVTVDFYRADGTYLGTKSGSETRLRGYEFRQLNEAMAEWGTVDDGFAVVKPVTSGGKLYAFATVIDNHSSGDAFFMPAMKKAAGAPAPTPTVPVPTATPTPGPTATPTPGATPAPTPTPAPESTINGPGGSTLSLPRGSGATGMTVSLSAADIAPLLRGSETAVSSAVKVSLTGHEPLLADGYFRVTLPVTGTVSDPSRLMAKALLTTGVSYPVLGTYDGAAKKYSVEVPALWNGWVFGVVLEPGVKYVSAATKPERETSGWRTPVDWVTCGFRVVTHTDVWSEARVTSDIVQPAQYACRALWDEGFRSPRMWIDPSTHRRVIHLVSGRDPNGPFTWFSACYDTTGTWCNPDSPNFSAVELTDAQCLSLGQIYYNVDEADDYAKGPAHMSPASLLIHEMTHASMFGNDIRQFFYAQPPPSRTTYTLAAWSEGGATLLGNTYQYRGNRLGSGIVYVRLSEPEQELDSPADSPEPLWGAYTKQDLLAWVAMKYANGSLTFLRSMYEAMGDATEGLYVMTGNDYLKLYREAVDHTFVQRFGKGLSDVYHEFALDRGYRRSPALALRSADSAAIANKSNMGLFRDIQVWHLETEPSIEVNNLPPLTTRLIVVILPQAVLARPTFDFNVVSSGADLSSSGVRVTVFREDVHGVMLPGGEIPVTNAAQTVKVPMTAPVASLSIFVSNTSVRDQMATVKLGSFGYTVFVGTWAPEHQQGNDCYTPAKLLAPPAFMSVFSLDKGALAADPGYLALLDPKYGWTLSGNGSISGDTATLLYKTGWIDFDDKGVATARLDLDVSWYGTRKPVPPASAAQGVTEYFEGPSNIVFKTSAPHAPCTTTFTSPSGMLVGPCPKPHCAP